MSEKQPTIPAERLTLKDGIEINAASNAKQKISPAGNIVGLDGRAYLIDAEGLRQKAITNGIKIPLMIEHGYGKHGGAAAGWIDPNSLEVREDGIYAAIEKNALGEELISSKTYLYYSPTYGCDRIENTLIVRTLWEVSLTNTPNLVMPEANESDGAKEINDRLNAANQKIATLEIENQALKQTIDETASAIEATAKSLSEANAFHRAAADKLAALEAENKSLRIDLAIEKNQILPADREFALTLNNDQLGAYIARSPSAATIARLKQPAVPKPLDNGDRAKRFVQRAINPNNIKKGVK